MTVEEILKKIRQRWWFILAVLIISSLIFLPKLNQVNYTGSIGLGANFNNPAFINNQNGTVQYVTGMDELSKYLAARFSSVEVQIRVSEAAGMGINSFDVMSPFYEITRQGGGFISIKYEDASLERVQGFIDAVKVVYTELLNTEMLSNTVLTEFQITPQTNFVSSIQETKRPLQIKILPVLAFFLLSVLVVVVIPLDFNPKKMFKKELKPINK
jgi:hypothetical protein